MNKDHFFESINDEPSEEDCSSSFSEPTEEEASNSSDEGNESTNLSKSSKEIVASNLLSTAVEIAASSLSTTPVDDSVTSNVSMSIENSSARIVANVPSNVDDSQQNGSTGLERQVFRIEAKLNEMQSVMLQIQRMIISSSIGVSASIRPEEFPELPLITEDSLNKFEKDLSEESYMKKVVSDIEYLNILTNV